MKVKLILLSLLSTLILGAAETVQGGFIGDVVPTPTNFLSAIGKVNRITIRMIPGACYKVYIGNSTMNIATGIGVYKAMYPNCTGGLSDEWTLSDDVTGTDSIDPSTIYIASDNYTEILWESTSTGNVSSSSLKTLGNPGALASGTSVGYGSYYVEAHIWPGFVGKQGVYLSTNYNAPLKDMYPNNGVVTGNITDSWSHKARSINSIASNFYVNAYVNGEYSLVTVWKFQ